jgi:23S rRNA (guanosine2251-2'-O)-methyltransferase
MSQVEGRNPVLETLKRGGVRKLLVIEGSTSDPKVKEIVDLAKRRGAPIEFVEKLVLDKMTETKHHQGVIALVEAPGYVALNRVIEKAGREPCVVILDGVQDPQNLGSILRTADAAGVDAVLIPKKEGVGLTPTVLRVSMGGGAYVPVARENIYPAVKFLKDEGFKLVAVDPSGDNDLWEEDLTSAVAFVFGGEGEGISPTLRDKCDSIVRIPMQGHVSSLNVGVSAAVVLYERLRQRQAKQEQRRA